MKKLKKCLFFIISACITFSCYNRENFHQTENALYTADTVMIDTKGRLLDLSAYLFSSDIDDKEIFLYLYNKFDHSIDVIDLDELVVDKNYPFEAGGPDGTGAHINFVHLLEDSLIFIKSYGQSAVYYKQGGVHKKLDWSNANDTKDVTYEKIPRNEIAIGSSDLKVFGLNYDQLNRNVSLGVLSANDNTVERFDIDVEKSYHQFVLAMNHSYLDPLVHLRSENDFILVSHQFSNEIFLFDATGKPVQTVHYEPKLTPKKARDLNGIKISTDDQLLKEYQTLLEQVRYGPPVWDKVKKRYMRLSAVRSFTDTHSNDSWLPDLKEIRVFISVFDADFNLISELQVPELTSEFVKYFAKDGKLWVYRNFEDELGFIVIDF